MVSIEEMEISCVGDQSGGKSQIYSDFINSHCCEVAQWLSRNLLVVSVKCLMIILPLSEDRHMCNKCWETLSVQMLLLFSLGHCYLSNRLISSVTLNTALSLCRNLFCIIFTIKDGFLSWKHLRKVKYSTERCS